MDGVKYLDVGFKEATFPEERTLLGLLHTKHDPWFREIARRCGVIGAKKEYTKLAHCHSLEKKAHYAEE